MRKTLLRQQLLSERRLLGLETYRSKSLEAQRFLSAQSFFTTAETLALYSPINNEVNTEYLFVLAKNFGKRVVYPRVSGELLAFSEVSTLKDLQKGAFGVAEPAAGEVVDPAELDLMVVPGLGFDMHGHRIGYGRGFYDRYLCARAGRMTTVGLCFELQLCDELPVEDHDQRLDFLVTELRTIPCHNGVTGSL